MEHSPSGVAICIISGGQKVHTVLVSVYRSDQRAHEMITLGYEFGITLAFQDSNGKVFSIHPPAWVLFLNEMTYIPKQSMLLKVLLNRW